MMVLISRANPWDLHKEVNARPLQNIGMTDARSL